MKQPYFHVYVCYFITPHCPVCNIGYGEEYFESMQEVVDYMQSEDFLCGDCEEELNKEQK